MASHRQISASKVRLLLQCGRPFDTKTEIPAGDGDGTPATRYGSCIHKLFEIGLLAAGVGGAPYSHNAVGRATAILQSAERVCAQWRVNDVEGAIHHTNTALDALQAWLDADRNPFGVSFRVVGVENAKAYNVRTETTRSIELDHETHTYVGLQPGEVGGTYDVLLYAEGWGHLVLDLKTGYEVDLEHVSTNSQLLTLALMTGARAVAILHSQKESPPVIAAAEVSEDARKLFAAELLAAFDAIGRGPRTGPLCYRCPAAGDCPALEAGPLQLERGRRAEETSSAPLRLTMHHDDVTKMSAADLTAGVDVLICDPPYSPKVHAGVTSQAKNAGDGRGPRRRDLGFAPLSPELRATIARCAAKVPRWSLIFCDVEGLTEWIRACEEAGAKYIRAIPWVRWSMPQLSGDRPPQGFELVACFWGSQKGRKSWGGPGNLTHLNHKCLRGAEKHTTEKPLDLMLDLVDWFSRPGDTVLDLTAGSGSTGAACKVLGRNFEGYETNPTWASRASERIASAPSSPRDVERHERWVATRKPAP